MTRPRGRTRAPVRRATRQATTRQRLLDSATRLFAEQGFSRVTVRDICRDAGANLAAVNYHFGDKLELYREVVEAAIAGVRDASDVTMNAPPGSAAEDKLRHYVRTFVPRIARPVAWILGLMRHEMAEPTPLAPLIAERAIMPRIRYLTGVVAELLDCSQNDPRVHACVISVQSQCLFYRPDPFREAVFPGWPLSDADLAVAANLIAEFSVAGIRGIAASTRGS
jgi:AcrR family transcriptional regulator